jgi:hypothetical protein
MRNLLLLLLVAVLTTACSGKVEVTPDTLDLPVGATATIYANRVPGNGPGIPIGAISDRDYSGTGAIAASGHLAANASSAAITIQALHPGTGFVFSGTSVVATVNVLDCLAPPELTPRFAAIEGKAGEQVFLRVQQSIPGGTFQWFTGPLGDTAHPIPFSNAPYYIDFTPRANGSYPFWVRQTTACGTADAAFVVNVGAVRRRGVGR